MDLVLLVKRKTLILHWNFCIGRLCIGVLFLESRQSL